jgi:3-oxoacyl-[acyl-carrier-protein] synthase II
VESRRVAVTGLGVVSCVGRGKDDFWSALLARRSGISAIESFPTEGLRSRLGGEIKGPGPRQALAYALEAARQALADAGLAPAAAWAKSGVALGTTHGEPLQIEAALTRCVRGGSSGDLFREAFLSFPGSLPALMARELGWRGPNIMLTSACAAGNFALAYAFEKIARGGADLMAAGGVDLLNLTNYAGFNRLQALAPQACAPFSLGRKGMIPAEGCAILILEELGRARSRGARVYAEFLGYGASCDARHLTAPDIDGAARALEDCLRCCGLAASDVDYISAHGTGTPANDKTETAAVKRVFGARAPGIPVSSIKALLGHAMGAATALEAAACCMALDSGVLPPTANFSPGDPDCDLDYVAEGPRRTAPQVVLSDGFAFGGSNCVIALAKPGWREHRSGPAAAVEPGRMVVTGLAEVSDPDPLALAERLLPDKDLRFVDKPMALSLAVSALALQDAGLDPVRAGDRVGIILDSSGELETQLRYHADLLARGPSGVEPLMFPAILANAAASRTAVLLGLKLLNESIAGSFPGGESALVCACDFLSRGREGIILAGGVWAAPEGACDQPQGAVMLVVETLAGARARKARIYAEVSSWEEGCDLDAQGRAATTALLDSVREAARGGSPVIHKARGLWGGIITLAFGPCPD